MKGTASQCALVFKGVVRQVPGNPELSELALLVLLYVLRRLQCLPLGGPPALALLRAVASIMTLRAHILCAALFNISKPPALAFPASNNAYKQPK